MKPAQYQFITRWKVDAPAEQVWNAIYNSLLWPQWWKGVVAVQEINPGDALGLGSIRTYTWRSVLPYSLRFNIELTQRQDHALLSGTATGDLSGTGTWYFVAKGNTCFVEYHWHVHTTKSWMNWLAPLLRPVFKYNHNKVMGWGARGLSERLQTRVLVY
jgi:hypothetical protein